MNIRTANTDDLEAVSLTESICFSPERACSRQRFLARLRVYGDHFLLLEEDGKLISFVDGPVTQERDLKDWMYDDASCHDSDGKWQMIFGVNTLPEYRNRGYAGTLIREMIALAKEEGRYGVVLTCLDEKVHYYAGFGFADEGICDSEHGGVQWHQMRLTF